MKAKISLRVSALQWMTDRGNEETLALLQAHPEVEEVAFFTQATHPPLPLAEVQKRAAILTEVIPRYRQIGVRAGINHLSTLGHLDENLDNSLREDWQRMVDQHGNIGAGSFCLSDERMREYIRESYRALANANPDFIWIDDDLRLEGHMPIQCACFCPLCLEKWSAQTGTTWTRENLIASWSEGTTEEKMAKRRAWLQHNRDYVSDGIRLIRQTVDEINPDLPLGFMTTPLPYSGAGFEQWARDLSGDDGSGERGLKDLPAMWRPGGGVYNDDQPLSVLNKAHAVGLQIAPVPAELTDIQYELENFPYQFLKKSTTILVAEIAAAIGAGCTGAALNVMGTTADSIGEFAPYFKKLKKSTPFLNRCVESFGRSDCEGIGIVASPDSLAAINAGGAWPPENPWMSGLFPNEWGEIGLPMAYGASGRRITALAGDSVLICSRDEVLEILKGGVVCDGGALNRLHEMGLGHLTGFASCGTRERDVLEVFSDDEINGRFAGWTHDCRPSFWPQTSTIFEPIQSGARVLSHLHDFKPQNFGAASGIFENELGGRVAVLGYSPWTMVHTLAKTEQLKSLCRWLSRDAIAAYVESFARAAIWCRRQENGAPAFLVLNASLDVQDISIRVLDAPQTLQCVRMDGSEESLCGEESLSRSGDETYSRFTIANLGAWQAALLV